KHALRVGAGQGECIGVADAGRHDSNEDFAGLRAFEIDLLDAKRLARLPCHRSSCFHRLPNSLMGAMDLSSLAPWLAVRATYRSAGSSMHAKGCSPYETWSCMMPRRTKRLAAQQGVPESPQSVPRK